ncbi:MAG TPA: hypothetical protein VMB81_25295 [Candidatus Sulfotelmatobacter sp.]|nr:hypothetical protein [Candidatus Sulfotelmatobacter sp.]
MDKRIVIFGGPGDGSVVAEAILQAAAAGADLRIEGFLNDGMAPGEAIHGFPILGRLEDWRALDENVGFIWAMQRVGLMPERVARLEGLGIPDDRWVSLRHPTACVASTADVGIGSFIASHVTVQPSVRIGAFASLRAGVNVGHHAVVGPHAYVGPNATLCGYARLDKGACLGPNAVLLEHKALGSFAIAGIGAAVTKDVPPHAVVMGNPARRVRVIRRPIERGASAQPTNTD